MVWWLLRPGVGVGEARRVGVGEARRVGVGDGRRVGVDDARRVGEDVAVPRGRGVAVGVGVCFRSWPPADALFAAAAPLAWACGAAAAGPLAGVLLAERPVPLHANTDKSTISMAAAPATRRRHDRLCPGLLRVILTLSIL